MCVGIVGSGAMQPTDPTTRFELITRNTEEFVTEDEIWDLAFDPQGKRAYVGYEPSGGLHLGHLVTVNKLLDLQNAGMDIVILLADIHARLNEKGSFDEIRATAEAMKEQFISYGLDPTSTEFVYGSDFQLEDEYVLDQHELAKETTLKRSKKAVSNGIAGRDANLRLSHATYPVMQAIDIPHLDIDLAVGGMAQRRVHMLARDNLPTIGYEAPTCLHTPLIMGLDGEPMSSSKGNLVGMSDGPETVKEKVTDAYCPGGELKENPIVDIFQHHIFPQVDQVEVERPKRFGGNTEFNDFDAFATAFETGSLHPQDAKETAAAYLNDLLARGREAAVTE